MFVHKSMGRPVFLKSYKSDVYTLQDRAVLLKIYISRQNSYISGLPQCLSIVLVPFMLLAKYLYIPLIAVLAASMAKKIRNSVFNHR